MKKLLVFAFFGVFMAFFAEAQTINFDDLKRPGKSAEKSWTLDGVSSEAQGHIKQFGEIDTTRVERGRSTQAAASTNSSSGKRVRICKLVCRTAGLMGDRLDLGSVAIDSEDYRQRDELNRICGKQPRGAWYVSSYDCK